MKEKEDGQRRKDDENQKQEDGESANGMSGFISEETNKGKNN